MDFGLGWPIGSVDSPSMGSPLHRPVRRQPAFFWCTLIGRDPVADLSFNPADVRDLGSHLSSIAREFRDANTRSDRIAGAVGHSGLEDAVKDFAHEWDDTREATTTS